MHMAQVDAKTAFLNGIVDEDIWVESPQEVLHHRARTFKLVKATHVLKQAHLMWHRRLCEDLSSLQFKEIPNAPCLFQGN